MSLLAIGINHQTASVELREKVAFTPEKINQALMDACVKAGLNEVVILSTCNRTEVYVSGTDDHQAVLKWLAEFHQLHAGELMDCHYYHNDLDAIRHLMRVASGLDSLVLGEPQILGQMKSAFSIAKTQGTVAARLQHIFEQVFAAAKKVRSETAIGANPVSVAYAAVSLSKRIFADLEGAVALLIGAGKTIELVARHLKEQGVNRIIIANRTLDRAEKVVAELGGEAILLSDIPARLHEVDIVISSTASQLPILGKGAVESALKKRRHKPVFMVDIAVPRDIEPEVGELDDVYLYSIDDLQDTIKENLKSREEAAREADIIIENAIEQYLASQRELDAVHAVKAYRQKAEELRDEETARALRLLEKGDDPQKVIRVLARNLTNKLLHPPTTGMKKAGIEGKKELLEWARDLFEIHWHDPE
ncbi:MAG: glutamyl-tRNA reductase [Pseudomonadales bacterium]|nr:glutamyl-tRNA reductase [Pseudomonadales bacterium]